MSVLTGTAYAGLADRNGAPVVAGLFAGEALLPVAPCYIASDGTVMQCLGTTGTFVACCPIGFTPRQVASGEPVSLYGAGAIFQFGSGLTPGARLYLSTTAGSLDTAATVGDFVGVAVVLDAKNIMVTRANGAPHTVVI